MMEKLQETSRNDIKSDLNSIGVEGEIEEELNFYLDPETKEMKSKSFKEGKDATNKWNIMLSKIDLVLFFLMGLLSKGFYVALPWITICIIPPILTIIVSINIKQATGSDNTNKRLFDSTTSKLNVLFVCNLLVLIWFLLLLHEGLTRGFEFHL